VRASRSLDQQSSGHGDASSIGAHHAPDALSWTIE
jgi:hypothetical protein